MLTATPCETKIGCKGPLHITRKEGRCNYHIPGKQPVMSTAPEGMCHAAYHALLPHALGILYSNTKFVEVACPAPDKPVVFRIEAIQLPIQFRMLNIIKRIVHQFLFPLALFKRGVSMRVITDGSCPKGLCSGKSFKLNVGNLQLTNNVIMPFGSPNDICPAAAASLYPFLAHSETNTQLGVLCPDHLANVDFNHEA